MACASAIHSQVIIDGTPQTIDNIIYAQLIHVLIIIYAEHATYRRLWVGTSTVPLKFSVGYQSDSLSKLFPYIDLIEQSPEP